MKDKKDYIKSPLNYTGGKFKLLPQILPLFPKEIDTFIDVFGGGFNVGINVDAKKVIFNDSMPILSELLNHWREEGLEKILDNIHSHISQYKLTDTTQRGYDHYSCESSSGVGAENHAAHARLKADYNRAKDISLFYTLVVFSFNNQIRFNKKGEFNSAVNKRDFNSNIRKNLVKFLQKLETMNVEFLNEDFRKLHFSMEDYKKTFFYFDPPYLGAIATYNERGGWTGKDNEEMFNVLATIDSFGGKFALSGVMENKGVENTRLKMWSLKYNVHYLEHSYGNCSYQAKDKSKDSTVEVLITNY